MKRGGPLRRVALTRNTPLNPGQSQLQRSPLAQVSAKRAAANRVRTKVLAPIRAGQPWCARCGKTGVGLDAHEHLSRAQGGSITNPENLILLCRWCHTWITENPREAAEQGWAISKKWSAA